MFSHFPLAAYKPSFGFRVINITLADDLEKSSVDGWACFQKSQLDE